MEYLTYTTNDGDRWDNIAFAAYGDISQMAALIAANREVGTPTVFAGGVELRVPILEDTDLISPDLLPPWKR